mgnify:FL=1
MADLIVSTLTQGLIFALLSYGVYITYSVLDFPDLTVDSSFPLGAAVTAILLLQGVNPWVTLLCAAGAGAVAGLCTGLIHVKLKVRDLLELASGRQKLTRDQCCSYLNRVGLCAADYIDREVDTSLSGGEVKRIEIATILARPSGLLIFDEPEAGIDLWSFAKLTETFRAIHQKREATLIVISHQERIIDLADEIVMISGGKVARHGPKAEIMPHILADTGGMCNFLQPDRENCRQPKED